MYLGLVIEFTTKHNLKNSNMCTQNKNERISSNIVLCNCLVLRGEEIGVDVNIIWESLSHATSL